MTKDKSEHHVIFGSAMLLVIFAGLTLFVVSIVQANPGPDSAASSATFRTKCAPNAQCATVKMEVALRSERV